MRHWSRSVVKLLNRTKAAELLGLNRRTLEQWEKSRRGPPVVRLPSGNPYYLQSDLEAFVSRHRGNDWMSRDGAVR
jgi:hypothetical protein